MKNRWVVTIYALLGAIIFCLAIENIRLLVQHSSGAQELHRLVDLHHEQKATISNAESKRVLLNQRVAGMYRLVGDVGKLSEWVRSPEEFLVRSGARVVSQFVKVDYDHVRLIVYLPNVPGESADRTYQLMFAIKEVWGDKHRPQNAQLREEQANSWPSHVELPIRFGEVQQFDFQRDSESGAMQILASGKLIAELAGKPAKVTGAAYGQSFVIGHPGQVFHPHSRGQFGSKLGDGLTLLNHTLSLSRQAERGGVAMRCWIESKSKLLPADEFAETFARYRSELDDSFARTFAGLPVGRMIVGDVLCMPEQWGKELDSTLEALRKVGRQ